MTRNLKTPAGKMRRWIILIGAVLAAGALGWWAARATLTIPTVTDSVTASPVLATVTEATVGRTLTVNATVSQPFVLVASNSLSGVVTETSANNEINVGDKIYSVAGVAARVITGEIPFYRDLQSGTEGSDVRQLQNALRQLGYLKTSADGSYGTSTARAVRAWQRDSGAEPSGVVALGQVISIPQLPATLRLAESIQRGALLSGGEQAVLGRSGEAKFALVLSAEQASLIPPQASLSITQPNGTWDAVVTGDGPERNGVRTLELAAPDGGVVCGQECSTLPPQEQVTLVAAVELVTPATGPGVPVAAVRTNAQGNTTILRADGSEVSITVRASGDGIAIVDGIDYGEQVIILPGENNVES